MLWLASRCLFREKWLPIQCHLICQPHIVIQTRTEVSSGHKTPPSSVAIGTSIINNHKYLHLQQPWAPPSPMAIGISIQDLMHLSKQLLTGLHNHPTSHCRAQDPPMTLPWQAGHQLQQNCTQENEGMNPDVLRQNEWTRLGSTGNHGTFFFKPLEVEGMWLGLLPTALPKHNMIDKAALLLHSWKPLCTGFVLSR